MVMTREEFESKARGEGSSKGGLSMGDIKSLAARLENAMSGVQTDEAEIQAVLKIIKSHSKTDRAFSKTVNRINEEYGGNLRQHLIEDESWGDEDSILKAFGFAEDGAWGFGDTTEQADARSTTGGLEVSNMERYGPDGEVTYGRGEPELDEYEQYLEDEVFNGPESKVIDIDAERTPPAEPEYPEDADQMPDDSEFGIDTPPPGVVDPGEGYLTEAEPTPDEGWGGMPGDEEIAGSGIDQAPKQETSSYVDINGEIITENLRDVDMPEPPEFPEPTINDLSGNPEHSIESLLSYQAQNAAYQQRLKQEMADQEFNTDLRARHSQANRANTTSKQPVLGKQLTQIGVNPATKQPIYARETHQQMTARINQGRQQLRDAQRNEKALADFNNPQPDNRRAATPSKKRNFDVNDLPYETRVALEIANLKGAGKLIDQGTEPKFKPAGHEQEHIAAQEGDPLHDPFVPGKAQDELMAWKEGEERRKQWESMSADEILAEADQRQLDERAEEIRSKMGAGSGLKTNKFAGALGGAAFGIDPSANRTGSFHKGWTGAHVPMGPDEGQEWTPEMIENLEEQMEIAGSIEGLGEQGYEPHLPAGIDESTLQDEPTRLPSGEILPPLPPDDNSGIIDSYMSDPTQWDSYNQVPPLSSAIDSADRLLEEMDRERNQDPFSGPETPVMDVPGMDMDAVFNGHEYPVIDVPPPEAGGPEMTWFPDMGSSPDNMYDGPLMPFDASGPTNIYDGPLYEEEDEEMMNLVDQYMGNEEAWSDYDPWNQGLY